MNTITKIRRNKFFSFGNIRLEWKFERILIETKKGGKEFRHFSRSIYMAERWEFAYRFLRENSAPFIQGIIIQATYDDASESQRCWVHNWRIKPEGVAMWLYSFYSEPLKTTRQLLNYCDFSSRKSRPLRKEMKKFWPAVERKYKILYGVNESHFCDWTIISTTWNLLLPSRISPGQIYNLTNSPYFSNSYYFYFFYFKNRSITNRNICFLKKGALNFNFQSSLKRNFRFPND